MPLRPDGEPFGSIRRIDGNIYRLHQTFYGHEAKARERAKALGKKLRKEHKYVRVVSNPDGDHGVYVFWR